MALVREAERSRVIGAAIEVHKVLGNGFLEAVYQEAMQIELELQGTPFVAKKKLRIPYKDPVLQKQYEADLICFGDILVELKALDAITDKEVSQALNYLKATNFKICLIINFGRHDKIEVKPIMR